MTLRKELKVPSIDEKLLSKTIELIEYISRKLELEKWSVEDDKVLFESEAVAKDIEEKKSQLKDLTKRKINILEFDNYECACSIEEVAIDFLMPEAPYVSEITEEQLAELIQEFSTFEQITVNHENYYLRLLEKSFGLNDISDYIFWPNVKGMSLDAEPIEIARKIIEDSKK
ncbi:hypothetical protein [Clostridium aquiflavi]|uniref:Uncharacterized protein n=1 Tax=Clostridium aquiflavi TaxID=3073603 RepID=A0ABU1ECL1_9CLOT|nr:hypothetical protein [Clostridium sp. 5N-1]MDR5586115.1 hypothetical protein [Clostridium sp. 5N-1]